MTRGQPSLFDDISNAASGAGSEALAAIRNVGGGDAGGTVGRLVSAVAGRHGGFAPKVITSVTKHGIAGIERVEPLEGVDRGYRAVAADANGLESIRTIIELDPREYDVTVTREEGAGVVEFVQQPEPEPEEGTVEPSPPVKRADSAAAGTGRPTQLVEDGNRAGAAPVRTGASRRDEVAEARAEAEKAKAEAEAEKARAEAETARAEAEAAKARARSERARAESRAGESLPAGATADGGVARQNEAAGGQSPSAEPARSGPARTGTDANEQATAEQHADGAADSGTVDAADVDPAFGSVPVPGEDSPADGSAEATNDPESVESARNAATTHRSEDAESELSASPARAGTTDGDGSGKWGLSDDAGAETVSSTTAVESANAGDGVTSPDAPLRTEEPLDAETVDGGGEEATVVEDGFGSFVAAEPVNDGDAESATDDTGTESTADGVSADEGIGRWAGAASDEDTGGFEF